MADDDWEVVKLREMRLSLGLIKLSALCAGVFLAGVVYGKAGKR
jgi:hypothetical protein